MIAITTENIPIKIEYQAGENDLYQSLHRTTIHVSLKNIHLGKFKKSILENLYHREKSNI